MDLTKHDFFNIVGSGLESGHEIWGAEMGVKNLYPHLSSMMQSKSTGDPWLRSYEFFKFPLYNIGKFFLSGARRRGLGPKDGPSREVTYGQDLVNLGSRVNEL